MTTKQKQVPFFIIGSICSLCVLALGVPTLGDWALWGAMVYFATGLLSLLIAFGLNESVSGNRPFIAAVFYGYGIPAFLLTSLGGIYFFT